MTIAISYAAALDGIFSESDSLAYVLDVVDTQKQWGSQRIRIDSAIITLLVEEIKRLKEQQLSYYEGSMSMAPSGG